MASAAAAADIDDYFTCSVSSTGETADDLPGPGRLLGNAYGFFGRKLENGLGWTAKKLRSQGEQVGEAITDTDDSGLPSYSAQVMGLRNTPRHSNPPHNYFSHLEFMEGDSPFPADNYTLCSRSISNLTADNLPGLGRVLGNAYVSFGRKLETRLGWAAEKLMHRGPREIALRIQTIYSDTTLSSSTRCKRVRKKCKTLDRYVRSNVPSTRKQALDQIIDLSVYDNTIRELLNEVTFRAIGRLRANPEHWCNMDASLQTRTRKALAALSDNTLGHIVNLLGSGSPGHLYVDKESPSSSDMEDEIRKYLFHEEFSFLVIRFLSRKNFYGFPRCISDFAAHISSFEGFVEWGELDNIFHHQCRVSGSIMNSIFRYSEKLPRSAQTATETFEGLDINGPNGPANNFITLQRHGSEMLKSANYDASPCTHAALKVYQKMMTSPPDMALGVICTNYQSTILNSHDRQHGYLKLSSYTDSDDPHYKDRALQCLKIALSLDRYTRRNMLQALTNTKFSTTLECKTLIDETSAASMEKKGKLRRNEKWKTLYRHFSSSGLLLHAMMDDRTCNGECGAVQEHVLDLYESEILRHRIWGKMPFFSEGHYPLSAGHNTNGEEVYIALLMPTSHGLDNQVIAIPIGIETRDFIMKVHYTYGITEDVQLGDDFELHIPVLKYDLEAYHDDGSGPCSWRFNRNLPDGSNSAPRIRSELDEIVVWDEGIVWVEVQQACEQQALTDSTESDTENDFGTTSDLGEKRDV